MSSFFALTPGKYVLQSFDGYHLAALATLFFFIVLIVTFQNKMRNNPKLDYRIRIIATVIAFVLEVSYHVSTYVYHDSFMLNLIPFDLCAMSLWLAFVLNVTKRKFIFNLLYFWALGAVASLVYPNCNGVGPDRLRYYHYFGVHEYIILTVIYFSVVKGFRIHFKSLELAIGTLFPIALVVRELDVLLLSKGNPNWMFLVSPPPIHTILDSLPQGGWSYFFSFTFIVIVVMGVSWLPWASFIRFKTKAKPFTGECPLVTHANQRGLPKEI